MKTIAMLFALGGALVYSAPAQKQEAITSGLPKLKPAVEITDLRILGTPTKGATVTLQVRFRSHVKGSGIIMLRYPGHLAPPGRRPEEKFRTQPLSLEAGRTYVRTYPLRVERAGAAMVEVIIQAEDPPEGYNASASAHLEVLSGTDTYQIFAPGDTLRQRVRATKGMARKSTPQTQAYYTVSVSGTVKFWDQDQRRSEGLFGNKVELWFRNSSNPYMLYHPVLGEYEHVHYDLIEEDGQYHFNFSFSGDLSGYDELLILVSTSNQAASLYVTQGAWIVDAGSGTEVFFGPSQGVVYDISNMGTSISISNADIEVNSQDGAILRNMMLARKFLEAFYNNNIPFDLPVVRVYKKDIEAAGQFCPNNSPHIEIDPYATEITTTTHEYGHYVMYRMWDTDCDFNNASRQLIEGWAIFFSFAARNYAYDVYGDNLRGHDDNTEEDAFDDTPYRFNGIRYADHGEPDIAAFACYLWSLYDSYDGGVFEADLYDPGDNDDVSGYALRVFEVMRTGEPTSVSSYHSQFKQSLPYSLQNSVQQVFDFMMDNLVSIPSTPMYSAQVRNATIQRNGTQLQLAWQPQSYPPGRFYGNYESGYRIYEKDGSTWTLLATVSAGTTSYSFTDSSPARQYKITAYNAAGESSNPPVIPGVLTVSLTGPSMLGYKERGSWTATASGGTGSTYRFRWYKRNFGSSDWGWPVRDVTRTTHTDTYSTTMLTTSFELKVEVTRGLETATATQVVFYGGGFCQPGRPCEPFASMDESLPETYALAAPYPNPARNRATIRFALPEAAHVRLVVYDALGREVARLADGWYEPGYYTAQLEASTLPAGLYVCRIVAGPFTQSYPLVLIR